MTIKLRKSLKNTHFRVMYEQIACCTLHLNYSPLKIAYGCIALRRIKKTLAIPC
ncbi:hypothetical protein LX64_01238 [Chitinophaga skermanii]|uniref:Uncharacterized protein n=1 Tax=Chitinophaga skermanii TaxID=331697 RepID=A0A327QX96_9BACT|nr:hypothetical protein LX64_01238 [Chitinophaga skermanii]